MTAYDELLSGFIEILKIADNYDHQLMLARFYAELYSDDWFVMEQFPNLTNVQRETQLFADIIDEFSG